VSIETQRQRVLTKNQQKEIKRFLETGESDPYAAHWPGGPVLGGREASLHMRAALVAEIRHRTQGVQPRQIPSIESQSLVRGKVEPMVRGLLPGNEQEIVLAVLEKSVVSLTPDNIEAVLMKTPWLSSVWDLANLYLTSMDLELLGKGAPSLLGLSEETTCYVSLQYFWHKHRFADFIVHEVAHVFHNCKRETLGLKPTRTREFLLNIDFVQRETFAYACEAYSRILALGQTRKDRLHLVSEVEQSSPPPEDRVDLDKYYSALRAAAESKNGWKQILAACSSRLRR
jgi:hypothetical protein